MQEIRKAPTMLFNIIAEFIWRLILRRCKWHEIQSIRAISTTQREKYGISINGAATIKRDTADFKGGAI